MITCPSCQSENSKLNGHIHDGFEADEMWSLVGKKANKQYLPLQQILDITSLTLPKSIFV